MNLSVLCFCVPFPGATVLHHAAVETIDLNFNSTNMTDFVYAISANVVAIVLYGSTFVPVKKIEMGDGLYSRVLYESNSFNKKNTVH